MRMNSGYFRARQMLPFFWVKAASIVNPDRLSVCRLEPNMRCKAVAAVLLGLLAIVSAGVCVCLRGR